MSSVLARRAPAPVQPPAQPVVEILGSSGLGEVTATTPVAHCHHTPLCLTPLRVGELVVPVAGSPFYALLEHVEKPPGGCIAQPS